jgi:hypothetical protein
MRRHYLLLVIVVVSSVALSLRAQTTPASAPLSPVETYLDQGHLADAERAMNDLLAAQPADDQARFSLGAVQFLHAVEHLSQTIYSYGPRVGGEEIQPFDLAIPANPNPKKISYDDARAIVATFVADLTKAEATLATIKDPNVKLPLRFGLIRLDLLGNGNPTEAEALWRLLAAVRPDLGITAADAASFQITFDAGDVRWLRGYCHLLMALGEMTLAYDEKELFDSTAHLVFARPDTPYPFLTGGHRVFDMEGVDMVDAIAFIHLFRLPAKEPARMTAALEHLRAMFQNSRESWKLILAETDDDHEWIPNPNQHTVLPRMGVTKEMIDGWMTFVDESDRILDGKLLIPFWRGTDDTVGVNLNKVFTAPRPLDLVLWVQGTAAAPYLEHGPVTQPDVWRKLAAVFEGDIFTFAAWFN